MSTTQINGASLYVEEHGTGDPILCIHGTGSSAVLWQEAARRLATRGRAILYDRRGFGRSERPDPFVTTVSQNADDAAALLDALGATPAVVIGRSQGGEIAVDLALRYPEHVRALALLEGGGMTLSPAFAEWEQELGRRVEAAAATDLDTVAEAMFRTVLGDGGWEGLPDPVRQVFVANGPAILAEVRGGSLDVDPELLAGIAAPTLLVAAKASPPEFADVVRLLSAAMPSARVAWVDGDHLIDPAHPLVLGFVDDVLARTPSGAVR